MNVPSGDGCGLPLSAGIVARPPKKEKPSVSQDRSTPQHVSPAGTDRAEQTVPATASARAATAGFSWNVAKKLPVTILAIALAACAAVGVSNYLGAKQELRDQAVQKLTAISGARKAALGDYLASIRQDLKSQAANPLVGDAIREFTYAWRLLGDSATARLQQLYIDENPHPIGEKENLDFAADGSTYSDVHKKYHPWFRLFLRERAYYDIFLFDPDGNLVYTVFKELDYATNLNSGEYKDTDLGHAFRAARDAESADSQFFFDFRPYAPSHGAPASFISTPVTDGRGTAVGVLVFQMPIGRLNGLLNDSAGLGESGETYLVGRDHLMRSDSRFSEQSTILKRTVESAPAKAALAGETGVIEALDYRGIEVLSVYTPFEFLGTRWAMLAEIDSGEILTPVKEMRNWALFSSVIVLAVVGAVGTLFARGVTGPLVRVAAALRSLADGNKSIEIPGLERTDEIGDLARAAQVFRANALHAERQQEERREEERRTAEDAARRELAQREHDMQQQRERESAERRQQAEQDERERTLEQQRGADEAAARKRYAEDTSGKFDAAIGQSLDTVRAAADEMAEMARSMSASAGQTNSQAAAAATAAKETTSDIETVAAATEQLRSSVSEIGRQVAQSSEIARRASTEADRTNDTVQSLADAAHRIGEVIDLINNIASQTNLLALNATIEAARAGEAGKGFAVVASEVKSLANQTAKATEEIASQIAGMQGVTDDAVKAIEGIGKTISEVNEIAASIAAAVDQQSAATQEIAASAQNAAAGTQKMSENIGGVTGTANETGSSADRVLQSAGDLAAQSEALRAEVDVFLADLRAA